MLELMTTVSLAADAPRVFEVLADAARWNEWTQSFRVIRPPEGGTLCSGATMVASARIPAWFLPYEYHRAAPHVSTFIPNEKIVLSGKMYGVIAGEHGFELIAGQGETCELRHSERCFGFLRHPIAALGLWKSLERSFEQFNQDLVARLERP